MMETPLNSWLLFDHAERHHANTEVVSRLSSGEVHRYTYADFSRRAQQLMHALDALDLEPGARVATLAWNSFRHLECYFGVPCSGRVLHTLNLRLSATELAFIISDAEDAVIFVDADLLQLLEKCGDALSCVRQVVLLGDTVPSTSLPNVVAYESMLAGLPSTFPRREIPEDSALGLCYTSGTTGRPKGVIYTHRSTFLHSLGVSSGAGMSIGPQDCVLPLVPMFHANAWGIPHAAVAVGAKQVFVAGSFDPKALIHLIIEEEVTISAAVPTVWLDAVDEFRRNAGSLSAIRHLICGGARPSRHLLETFAEELGIPLVQAWGMTETSPFASVAWPKHNMRHWSLDRRLDVVGSQAGLPLPGVDVLIRDGDQEVPADGSSSGELLVRGPWIADSYFKVVDKERFTPDGWLKTGDVAIESPDGYFVISDRAKDVIKSGGEWISSIDMEGQIMAMPEVLEAAVVAISDPKWQERPLACIVPASGCAISLQSVRDYLELRGWARWQLPDQIQIVDSIPKTSVGKFDKKVLRARFDAE